MAKKVGTFADKLAKAASRDDRELIKYVKAYKAENGAWKFKTGMVEVTDENRKEIFG